MLKLSNISVLFLACLTVCGQIRRPQLIFPTTVSSAIYENVIAGMLANSASTASASSYATVEDFTESVPRANSLMLAFVVNSKASAPDTPTFSGFGVTWAQVATTTFNTIASPTERITLFYATTNATPLAKPGTASFSANQTGCLIDVLQFQNVVTNFIQTVTTNKDTTANPAIPYATVAHPGSSLLVWAYGDNAASSTDSAPPSGWAEDRELNYGTPSTGGTFMWQIESPAGNSATVTATSRSWGGILVEVTPSTWTPTSNLYGDIFIDFENSTDGTTQTTTILGNGTHNIGSGSWEIAPSPLTTTTVSTSNQTQLHTPVTVNGTTYTTSGDTRTTRFDYSSQGQYVQLDLPDYKNRISMGFFAKYGPTNDFVFYDTFVYFSALDYVIGSYEGNGPGTYPFKVHTQAGTSAGSIAVTPNHVYWVTALWNYGYGGKIRIYDPAASWAQVGSEITLGFGAALQGANAIVWGRYDTHGPAASTFTYMDNIIIDFTHGVFPLGP